MVNEALLQQLLELGLEFTTAICYHLCTGAVDAQDVLGKGVAGVDGALGGNGDKGHPARHVLNADHDVGVAAGRLAEWPTQVHAPAIEHALEAQGPRHPRIHCHQWQ
jgi:hypothetical protein